MKSLLKKKRKKTKVLILRKRRSLNSIGWPLFLCLQHKGYGTIVDQTDFHVRAKLPGLYLA